MDFYREKKVLIARINTVLKQAKAQKRNIDIDKLTFVLTNSNGGFGRTIVKKYIHDLENEQNDFYIKDQTIIWDTLLNQVDSDPKPIALTSDEKLVLGVD